MPPIFVGEHDKIGFDGPIDGEVGVTPEDACVMIGAVIRSNLAHKLTALFCTNFSRRFDHEDDDEHEDETLVAAASLCASVVKSSSSPTSLEALRRVGRGNSPSQVAAIEKFFRVRPERGLPPHIRNNPATQKAGDAVDLCRRV